MPDRVDVDELTAGDRARSSMTPVRLGVAVVSLVVCWAVVRASGGDRSAFAENAGPLLRSAPEWTIDTTVTAMQVSVGLAAFVGLVALLASGRFERLGVVALAGVAGGGVMIAIGEVSAPGNFHVARPEAAPFGVGLGFPSLIGIAALVGAVVVDSPWWSVRLRRAAHALVVCAVLARVVGTLAEPATVLVAASVGWVVGHGFLLVGGMPNLRPTTDEVATVLADFGFVATRIADASSIAPGYDAMLASDADGRGLFVKILTRESWKSRRLIRFTRWLRYRDVGEDRPFGSVKHPLDREALGALKAYADGVPTARLVVSTNVGTSSRLLAYEVFDFRQLTRLGDEEWTPELLTAIWRTVGALRASRTAHHRLSFDHLLLDGDGIVRIVDFESAELGAPERMLNADVAEVLAATAAQYGAPAAVRAAIRAVGVDAVAAAAPRLQPLALTPLTRSAVKRSGVLPDLTAEVARSTGVPDVPLERLQRVKGSTVFLLATTAVAAWALAPQLLGAGDVWGLVRNANWGWAAVALGVSALTYVAAAVAFAGSLPEPVPLGPNVEVQLATSFVAVAATAASLALSARFLHKRGIDTAVSVAAVSINTVAGVVVHLGLLGVFLGLGGTDLLERFTLPSASTVMAVVGAVTALLAISMAVPVLRRLARLHVVPPVQRAMHGLSVVAHSPTNVAELLAGSAGVTLGYVVALAASANAFGSDLPIITIGLVYLLASVVSVAAPTPGGLGAVEATLIAGLTAAGMQADMALGSVLLFRLATFWIPLLPGWVAYQRLATSGAI